MTDNEETVYAIKNQLKDPTSLSRRNNKRRKPGTSRRKEHRKQKYVYTINGPSPLEFSKSYMIVQSKIIILYDKFSNIIKG